MSEGREPAPSRIPGETHRVRRLLPDAAATTVAEQVATLDLKPLALPERPYLILNYATTLDGRAASNATNPSRVATSR